MINYTLLEKLAKHLEQGQLIHNKFDFEYVSYIVKNDNFCGTAGCAVGELPAVCPDVVVALLYEDTAELIGKEEISKIHCTVAYKEECGKHESGHYIKLHKSATDSATVAKKVLGLTTWQFNHLFIPTLQNKHMYGGRKLSERATKEQVAANIREFINTLKQHDTTTA